MHINLRSFGFVLGLAAICVMLFPQDSRSENKALSPQELAVRQQEIDEFSRPGPQHEFLKKFEGKWRVVVHYRGATQAPVTLSENTARAAMIMDGRYLDKVISNSDGTFNVRITYGFDNYRKEFTMVWVDNQCTGMIVSSGHLSSQPMLWRSRV